jgi:polyribonucleotide nucleotidyltransferase
MKKVEKSIELGGKKLTLSVGRVAEQASGAVLAQYGETVVLATVVAKNLDRELDYFPMTVDYQERYYAGGRIKGSKWVKREGRPTDEEILSGRLIDRSLRPLFPKAYKKDVQIIAMVMSVDFENDPRILAGVAASAAVAISQIPWQGPVAVINVGLKGGKFVVNPTKSEMAESDLDLVVSSTKDAIVMVEAGAQEVPEEKVLEGIEFAQKESKKVLKLISELTEEVGKKKESYEELEIPASLVNDVKKLVKGKLEKVVEGMATHEGSMQEYDDLKAAVADQFSEEKDKKLVGEIIHNLEKQTVRDMVLSGKRADGRKLTEIRKLSAEVSVLPRVHGSALFARGTTQAMSIATIGAPSLEQLFETAEGEESKTYIHHYSMPPYSTGETGKVGQPSRREIGHGALAERALVPVIPSQDVFPYAIRVVTEVMSSNGSTSMASVCGSTLSLMDAGVPLKEPVSGIAMGLVIESDKKFAILSDIMGIEDFNGDMDFKVTGTKNGVTAMQLDVKTLQLTSKILSDALKQAKEGRAFILDFMLKNALSEPRKSVSKYAPKIKSVKIPVEKIGELVGPGGRTIKGLVAETGAEIEVDDKGVVFISDIDETKVNSAVSKIELMMKEPQKGEIYEGEVKRLQSFGAFVEILPGKDGLVHVSDMSTEFVRDPEDLVKIGQKVSVRVKEIDDMGRLNLSMVLDPAFDATKEERRKTFPSDSSGRDSSRRFDNRGGGGRSFGGDRNRGRSSFGGGDRGRGGFSPRGRSTGYGQSDRNRGERSSGPHFPTSRFVDDKKGGFGK